MLTISPNKNKSKESTLRKIVFGIVEQITRVMIETDYDIIKRINENHESDYAIRQRKKYLFELLQHALDTVPFYRNLDLKDVLINRFPIADKNLIRQQFKAFISESYTHKKTYKASTSGSTGTPFTVLHDLNKKRRHKADLNYYWNSVNHRWGNKIYYLRIWTEQNKKSPLTQRKQNIVPIDVFKLNDHNIKKLLNNIIADKAPKSILGYASALDNIVKYLRRHPTDMSKAGVITIVAMSESLDHHTKNYLEERFACHVVSRYANTENGMLAQQTAHSGNDFLINLASYHVEILDLNEDIPAKNGKPGRIVVTDLFNRAMPLIRYDTGDLGVLRKILKNGKTQYVLSSVEGRKMDVIYATNGEPISSFILTNTMWKYNELSQYQFIQQGHKEYEFLLNAKSNFSREEELVTEFKGYMGYDANIAVTYVDEIPLLSSGKRKKVLNHITV